MAPEKQKHVMVLMGGGRITPNIAGVWSLRPDEVRYLISGDQLHTYKDMRNVLDHVPWLNADTPSVEVPAHDIPAIKKAVEAITQSAAKDSSNPRFTFNTTCGSKTMAIAVYEVAKQSDRVVYIDSFNNRIIDWTPPYGQEPLTACDLKTYLANFGRQPKETFSFERLSISKAAAIELANRFVALEGAADSLLLKMEQLGWKKDRPTRNFRADLSTTEFKVLRMMADQGLIVNMGQTKQGFWKYTIPHAMHWNFIKGDWLEVYVYAQAHTLRKKDNKLLFDQMTMSLAIPSGESQTGQREIDFVGLYGWQLIWCSCKAEKNPFNKKRLDEVGMVNAMLGGRYATPIFVCNGRTSDDKYERFSQQARNARIVLVTRDRLPEIAAILHKEATMPTFRRV